MQSADPAYVQILTGLRRLAVEAYGEERASALQPALESAAEAVWLVTQEPLEPSADVP